MTFPYLPKCSSDFSLEELDPAVLGSGYIEKLHQSIGAYLNEEWDKVDLRSRALIDVTWEHLNTGHWKDVSVSWRRAYSILCLIKAIAQFSQQGQQGTSTIDDAVKTCDMGLLMGSPILDNVLTKLVRDLQDRKQEESPDEPSPKKLKSSSPTSREVAILPSIEPKNEVKRISCPSLALFKQQYMDTETPVIITDAIDYWPAFNNRKWSIPYLKHLAGPRTVPIEIGSKYTEDSWSQTLMTVKEFIETHIEKPSAEGGVGYLAQHQLFDQIPELQRDISVPTYCSLSEDEEASDVDINAWFGPKGTISPMHQDPKHNLLAQVVGCKYLKLISAKDTDKVYPHGGHILFNTSQVDAENPDYNKFPLFKEAKAIDCILREGEMLYLPPKYWHYVRSLSTSFSVSFWWM